MSPLHLEGAECGRTWASADKVEHRCTLAPGHGTACQCYCGMVTGGAS